MTQLLVKPEIITVSLKGTTFDEERATPVYEYHQQKAVINGWSWRKENIRGTVAWRQDRCSWRTFMIYGHFREPYIITNIIGDAFENIITRRAGFYRAQKLARYRILRSRSICCRHHCQKVIKLRYKIMSRRSIIYKQVSLFIFYYFKSINCHHAAKLTDSLRSSGRQPGGVGRVQHSPELPTRKNGRQGKILRWAFRKMREEKMWSKANRTRVSKLGVTWTCRCN